MKSYFIFIKNNKRIFIRNILILLAIAAICSVPYLLNKYLEVSYVTIVLTIVTTVIGITIAVLSANWLIYLKAYLKRMKYSLHSYSKSIKYRVSLLMTFRKIIKHSYQSHAVEIVFGMFCHFYEHHYQNENGWELDHAAFPEGKVALAELYKWIKKTRTDNSQELSMLDFNEASGGFSYWGDNFQTFMYKIDKNGKLEITPIAVSDSESVSLQFHKKIIKLQQDLYDLDNDKAMWILTRRKHLMI